MNSFVRWILVLPAVVIGGIAAWASMLLVWNVVRFVNIVPQDGAISVAIANFGINFVAAAAAVLAGAAVAPVKTRPTRIGIGLAVVALALATFVAGEEVREALSMSAKWHILAVIAWASGAVFGAGMAGEYAPAT